MLVTLRCGLQLILSKTIRIGDIKYHIYCSSWSWFSNLRKGVNRLLVLGNEMLEDSYERRYDILVGDFELHMEGKV